MNVNFYKKPLIKNSNSPLKVENSVLFLDYLEHFISNANTKRVQGYGTVGLFHIPSAMMFPSFSCLDKNRKMKDHLVGIEFW